MYVCMYIHVSSSSSSSSSSSLLLLLSLPSSPSSLLTHFFSTSERKYTLNAFAIACGLLVDLPSIFKTCASLIFSLPNSNFMVSQIFEKSVLIRRWGDVVYLCSLNFMSV